MKAQIFNLLPLPSSFYGRDTLKVAKELIGKLVIRKLGNETLIGRIVETEGYLEGDEAAHSFRGITERNRAIFEEPGRLYIHQIHKYNCMDIVAETKGKPGSVLIRAMEPLKGIEIMKKNRKKSELKDLLSGPGKICMAFEIAKKHYGLDITNINSEIYVADDDFKVGPIETSKRIGITKNAERLYRFILTGSEFISR